MARINYNELNAEKIKTIQDKVDNYSQIITDIVNEIIKPYIAPLDRYVSFISECLRDGTRPPTDGELEDFCMNLSTYIYFAGGACEQLGIKDDISREIYKELFNEKRDEIAGTISDKDAYAELQAQQEQITNICYTRAYKTMKSKVDNAQELLQSCKKVLSRRIQELSLTSQERR